MTEAKTETAKVQKPNVMKGIKIEKLTINVGAGKDQSKLDKAVILIEHLTGTKGIKTITSKRIPGWGLRPGLPIGCKLTIRNQEKIKELLTIFLASKENLLKEKQFDNAGNLSFGIHEYIDIPTIEYNPDVGIMGFQICLTLSRPGYRVKQRRANKAKIGKNHLVTKDEAIEFMKANFNITLEGEE